MTNQKYDQNPSFSKEEEMELYEAMKNGCDFSRDEFILRNQGLIWYTIKKHFTYITLPSTVTQEDLVSEGQIGLITAVDKFDPTKGKFSTYAVTWIKATISQFLHSFRTFCSLSLHVSTALNQIDRIANQLAQELQRTVTDKDLIEHPEVKKICSKKVLGNYRNKPETLLQIRREHSNVLYLDQNLDSQDGQSDTIKDLIPDTVTPAFDEQLEKKDLIGYLFSHLNEEERFIISAHFGLFDYPKLTYEQIGEQLGVKGQRIQQLKSAIVKSLQTKVVEDPELIELFSGKI